MQRYARAGVPPLGVVLVRTFHPIYEHADPQLIAAIDERHCQGNFGFWARYTTSAYDVCRERRLATLTADVADIAIVRHHDCAGVD